MGLCKSGALQLVDHVNTKQQRRGAEEIDFRDVAISPN